MQNDMFFPRIGRGHTQGIRQGHKPCCAVSALAEHNCGRGKNYENYLIETGRMFIPVGQKRAIAWSHHSMML